MAMTLKVARYLPGLFVLLVACGFPPPPLIGDDAGPPGTCQRDEHCSSPTPYCIDTACAACRTSATCPASTPVCDPTSHACRTCSKDSECDSGACDLAAGTCVDRSAILYASPTGNNADPCTQAAPCSLARAASIVDPAHPYIVLEPGVHRSSSVFEGVNVTLAGHGATVDGGLSALRVGDGTSMRVRDLKFARTSSFATFGGGSIVSFGEADLTLDNVEFSSSLNAIEGGGRSLTIRNSRFSGAFILISCPLLVDRTTFVSGAGIAIRGSSQEDRLEILNSIFIAEPASETVLYVNDDNDTTSRNTARIANNTFIGGSIVCGGGDFFVRLFESNIFDALNSLPRLGGCEYRYNLVSVPTDLGGMGNISGSPRFVDAANNDFHLAASSPAIDAGPARPAVLNGHDHDGIPRPQGMRVDIGAFEYVP